MRLEEVFGDILQTNVEYVPGRIGVRRIDLNEQSFGRKMSCLVCLINPEFPCDDCGKKFCEDCLIEETTDDPNEMNTAMWFCPDCYDAYYKTYYMR